MIKIEHHIRFERSAAFFTFWYSGAVENILRIILRMAGLEFYRFYRNKMLCLTAQPNPAHRKLADLEAAGKVKAVVTQNIDGLHQLARKR